jgi:hypothetical protein
MIGTLGRWVTWLASAVRWTEDWLPRTIEALDGERFLYNGR